jgi:hypothetical protein
MKRAVFLCSLVFICLAASQVAFGQSDARPQARKACPFTITGMWRSDVTSEVSPIYFSFSPEGHVLLMNHSSSALPQDFEVITSVAYKLVKPAAPKRIEFSAWRGNDVFPPGITILDITEYDENSFTTVNPSSKEQTRWVREQTERYFLTFAARSGPLPAAGPAFAMWTVLDGREPKVKALGVQLTKDSEGKIMPVFGPIPAEVYDQVTEESEKDKKKDKPENVIMRFELTRTEFEKTQETYKKWDEYVRDNKLPHGDAYLNVMEFLAKAADGLNLCGEKVKLYRPTQRERDELLSKHNPLQRPLEYIRIMRKRNDEMHVNDVVFPWRWRPTIELPVQ